MTDEATIFFYNLKTVEDFYVPAKGERWRWDWVILISVQIPIASKRLVFMEVSLLINEYLITGKTCCVSEMRTLQKQCIVTPKVP